MGKGLFVTGTGTDVGKTYVTALMVKKLHQAGYRAGYYKAALSGAECIADSDAGYVKRVSGILQEEDTMVSYLYRSPVSPHLAARWEKHPAEIAKVRKDYESVKRQWDYVTVEGSGGIVCPIRWDEKQRILLEDIVRELQLNAVLVTDAGLGSIHAAVTSAEYLKHHGISVKGLVLNRYLGDEMQKDNRNMMERLTELPVLACVSPRDEEFPLDPERLASLYE